MPQADKERARQEREAKHAAEQAAKTKAKEDAEAARLRTKEEAEAAKQRAKEEAESAKARAKEEAEAAKLKAKEETEKERVRVKEQAEAKARGFASTQQMLRSASALNVRVWVLPSLHTCLRCYSPAAVYLFLRSCSLMTEPAVSRQVFGCT